MKKFQRKPPASFILVQSARPVKFAIVRGRKLIGGRCKMDLRHLGRNTRHDARNRENAGPAEAAARSPDESASHSESSASPGSSSPALPQAIGYLSSLVGMGQPSMASGMVAASFYVNYHIISFMFAAVLVWQTAHLPVYSAPDHVGAAYKWAPAMPPVFLRATRARMMRSAFAAKAAEPGRAVSLP